MDLETTRNLLQHVLDCLKKTDRTYVLKPNGKYPQVIPNSKVTSDCKVYATVDDLLNEAHTDDEVLVLLFDEVRALLYVE